jgi:ABC-type Fe3+-hydroxamate transport system substrate-binding protein
MALDFTDETGTPVRLPAPPRRLVSLVPGLTETLFASGAGESVVGVSDYCNRPAAARTRTKVGGVRDPRIPAVLELRPDLVFASVEENRPEDVRALREAGIPVYVADPRSVDGALKSIRSVGRAAGRGAEARAVADALASRIRSVPLPRAPVPVFMPVWEDPLVSPGRNTFVADLLRRAGAVSVSEDLGEGWPRCGPEFPAKSGAAAVLLPSEPYPFGEADRWRWLGRRELRACSEGHVYLVDGDLVVRPGPGMAEGIEAVNRIVTLVSAQIEE